MGDHLAGLHKDLGSVDSTADRLNQTKTKKRFTEFYFFLYPFNNYLLVFTLCVFGGAGVVTT